MRFINLLQALLDHVRVDLCRGNIRVAQHELDRAEVRTPFEKVRGKTVPQLVRRKAAEKTEATSVVMQNLPNRRAAQPLPKPRKKEHVVMRRRGRRPRKFRSPLRQILFDGFDG